VSDGLSVGNSSERNLPVLAHVSPPSCIASKGRKGADIIHWPFVLTLLLSTLDPIEERCGGLPPDGPPPPPARPDVRLEEPMDIAMARLLARN